LLDTTVDVLQPAAMINILGSNGQLKLGAVESIVSAEPLDNKYPNQLPNVLGQDFHLNETSAVNVRHVWIRHQNPSGIFEDCKPRVNCS
jgi:hypothetical protein